MAIEVQETNALFSKQLRKKTNNDKLCFVDSPTFFNSSGSPPYTDAIIIIDDDDEEEKVTLESKKRKRSPPSTDAIIIIDDDDEEEKVTLEPKQRKQRLGSWLENVEPFDELFCVVKRSRNHGVESRASSCSSSTDFNVTKTNEKNDEIVGEISTTRRKNKKKDYEHVTLEDLEISIEDLKSIPWESFETKTNEKNDDEGSLPKKKNDEIVGEISTMTRNKKKDYEHMTLEDLEVSMEDLKSIPWESFDTTWEITSDPWLGGYIEDQLVSL